VSRETISKITDRVLDELAAWANRPLDRVYPVLFIDAIVVKIRDGQVTNRPVYSAVGVTLDGERDVLGLWVGSGGEGAKFWLQVLTEIKTAAPRTSALWSVTDSKACQRPSRRPGRGRSRKPVCSHLIRNTFRLASRADWDAMARDLRPVYIAPTEQAAKERFGEFAATWGTKYPAVIRLWESAWSEFAPFLDYSPEIRRVIYSTNAVEALHARFRRATRARGHFPNEQAAVKCLYLVIRSLDPTGTGRKRWMTRWKPALNAFAITFEGRIFPTST
jgi:putative transposase